MGKRSKGCADRWRAASSACSSAKKLRRRASSRRRRGGTPSSAASPSPCGAMPASPLAPDVFSSPASPFAACPEALAPPASASSAPPSEGSIAGSSSRALGTYPHVSASWLSISSRVQSWRTSGSWNCVSAAASRSGERKDMTLLVAWPDAIPSDDGAPHRARVLLSLSACAAYAAARRRPSARRSAAGPAASAAAPPASSTSSCA